MNYNEAKHVKLEAKFPSIEEAQKLCEEFERPLNNYAIVLNNVAPMVTAGGIIVGDTAHKTAQEALNKKCMLVVKSPFGKKPKEEHGVNAVYEGEFVKFQEGTTPAFSRVVTTDILLDGLVLEEGKELTPEMYKKYVVLCIGIWDFVCVIKKEE
jgi:co-chaperonin GroES (HSP10)